MDKERQILTEALALHEAGNADAAGELYRQVLAANRDNVDALHLLGLLEHEQGRHDAGAELIVRAIELQPNSGVLQNSLGVVQLSSGQLEEAAEAFQSALRLSPGLAEAHRNLGLARQRLGQLDLAEASYQHALRLDPSSGETLIDLAELAEQRGDRWTAESSLRQVLATASDPAVTARATVALGRVLNLQDRADEVCQLLQPLLVADPTDSEIQLQLGIALGKLGEHQRAAEHLRHAFELAPESATVHFNLSVCLLSLDEPADSLHHAEFAFENNSTIASRRHLATVLRRLGEFDRAFRLMNELRVEREPDPGLLEELAEIELERGDSDQAIELYRASLEVDPSRRRTLLRLAELCEAANQIDRTVETCVGILKRDPNSVAAHLLLGLVLSSRLRPEHRAKLDLRERDGLAERAFSHLQRAATIDPSAETFDAWGQSLLHAGRHSEAIDRLKQAIAFNPDFAPSHENLGRGWLELGKMDEARESFRAAIAIDPASPTSHYELARLETGNSAEAAIDELQQLLSDRSLTSHRRMMYHFALARRWDSIGQYDAAFEHYILANSEKEPPTANPSAGTSDATDRMVRLFDETFFSAADKGSDSNLPVFIVGMPRSGTTLVEQILSSHPKVFGAGELNDISDLANSLTRSLKEPVAYPESVAEIDRALATDLADQYLARLRKLSSQCDTEVSCVTDKMPTNFRHLGLIARLFPQARVIHLRRNPRDVCISCFKQNLAWPFCDLRAVGEYFGQYLRLMEHWRRVLPNPIHDLHYERLIENQETESRRLIEFLGLEWNDACLKFAESERAVQTPSKWQVRQPVYKTSVNAWTRYEKFLGPLLEALGEETGE